MCPIVGLTDTVRPALPTIGKLRKGGEAQRNSSGQVVKMGPDLSHFRFTSDRAEVAAAFEDAYGETPALVRIYLPYADVDRNFACWREKWSQGGLVHRCDGETMQIWLGPDGQYHKTPKPCDGGCDEVGRLSVIVPELVQAGYVGYVTLETHGIHDLLSIQGSLLAAAEARAGNDLGLRGIQWNLRRVQERISTPAGNGKRARREKWLVKLEPAADWVQLQLQAAHNATMMLPAPSREAARMHEQEADVVPVDPATGEIIEGTAREVPADTATTAGSNGQAKPPAETHTAQAEQATKATGTTTQTTEAEKPKKKMSLADWHAWWQTKLEEAKALGITGVAPLPEGATPSQIVERGKGLKILMDEKIAERDAILADQAVAAGEDEATEAAYEAIESGEPAF